MRRRVIRDGAVDRDYDRLYFTRIDYNGIDRPSAITHRLIQYIVYGAISIDQDGFNMCSIATDRSDATCSPDVSRTVSAVSKRDGFTGNIGFSRRGGNRMDFAIEINAEICPSTDIICRPIVENVDRIDMQSADRILRVDHIVICAAGKSDAGSIGICILSGVIKCHRIRSHVGVGITNTVQRRRRCPNIAVIRHGEGDACSGRIGIGRILDHPLNSQLLLIDRKAL